MLVSIVFLAGTFLGLNDAASLSEEPAYIQVEVRAGDTLWELAAQYGPERIDRRQVIYEICELNDVQANEIHPGQTILIPEKM